MFRNFAPRENEREEIPQPYFEGLEYPANQIKKFILTAGIFTLMLKTDKIVTLTPDHCEAFLNWLVSHDIADIRKTG